MPIALLLEESVLTFRFGAKQFEPWAHLVQIEELLIDRARSAFLVRWFGTGLPLHGLNLRAVIENIGQFRNHYLEALQSAQDELSGPNLFEPLAGAGGSITGIVLSPTGVTLTVSALARDLSNWVKILLVVLGGLIGPPLILGLGLPIGLIGGVTAGFTQEEYTGTVVELFGSLARVLDSARVLLAQLLGPRDQVVNPLLRQFLVLLDHLAGLGAQMIGFLAVVITRLGPLMVPLVAQINAFQKLFHTAIETIKFLITDVFERLALFLDPEQKEALLGTILLVAAQLSSLLPGLIDIFVDFFKTSSAQFKALQKGLTGKTSKEDPKGQSSGFKGFFETVLQWLDDAIRKSPLMMMIDAAKLAFGAAGAALSGPFKLNLSGFPISFGGGKSNSPSTFPSLPPIRFTSAEEIKKTLGGEPELDFGKIEPLATRANKILEKRFHGKAIPLEAEAEAQLERFRHPALIFDKERKRLEDEIGGAARAILATRIAGQQQLRNLIYGVVGRVLPAEIRPYLDSVGSAFASYDALVLAQKDVEKPEFPVRDIPDNGKLRTVIHRLVVKSVGGKRIDLQDFAARLTKAFDQQDYPAPEVAPA